MMNQIQPNLPTILITGASGGLAETVATLLEGKANLIGVDTRALPYNSTFTGKFYQMDYHHRRMTEIFENEKRTETKLIIVFILEEFLLQRRPVKTHGLISMF